ncbi:MAG: ATP-binding protein [Phycisphaeraceae bacterium]|nr:ATP-binding protein [Phycisphaeraceae bacterium]
MDHLLEVSRIIDGALKGDRAKVLAYVEQLARKLRESGDPKAADRLAQTASQTKASEVTPNIAGLAPGRLPVDSESRFSLADEEWVTPADVQVVLDSAVQQRLDEFLRHVKAAERLIAHRVDIAPSMLIYGAPGVGKTQLARHIAAQLGLPLITARSDSLISSFLGSTAKNLRVLFEHVKSRPCVLFLDELDSVAKLRDDHHELGELKRVVVSLLQNIDALSNETVLLGATNHPHLLDAAVWRRFSYKLELRPPDAEARHRMFKLFLGGFIGEGSAVADFVAVSGGATGSDIRHACETAIREAVIDDRSTVSDTDVLRSLVHVRLGTQADFSRDDGPLVKAVRDLAPDVFTLKRLSALFGSSEPTLSRRLHSDDSHGQQRAKAPNQGRPHTGRGSSGKARSR